MKGQDDNVVASRDLYEWCRTLHGAADVMHVRSLLEAKANPWWTPLDTSRCAAGYPILRVGDELCVRHLYDRASKYDGLARGLLACAISGCFWKSAKHIMEFGAPYKSLRDVFWSHGIDCTSGHNCEPITDLYEQFIAREEHCRLAACCIMSVNVRIQCRVPKDLLRLLAEEVWSTRLREEWEMK